MTHTHDLVPTSSPPRPAPGDDLPKRPRPSSPSPLGDEVAQSRPETPTNTTPPPRPRDEVNNPGRTWLITPRTTPAWTAVRDLLDDGHWHPTTDVAQAMRAAANLADRTIAHHLRAASTRGWIQQSRGRVRLRHADLIDQALDQKDGS